MKRVTRAAFGLAGAVVAAGVGLGVFVGSGVYNIGADDHHTRITLALIEHLRARRPMERSRSCSMNAKVIRVWWSSAPML